MAGSPPRRANASEPGQDWITNPPGITLPWSTSPMPCSSPASPATTPIVETVVLVALLAAVVPAACSFCAVVVCISTSSRRD